MSEPIRKERTYCPHCGSGWEPYFSRSEPMGFYCRDCGKDVDDKTAVSNTPRTDKETGISIGSGSIVFASFARKLERELAAVTEERDRFSERLSDVRDVICDALPDMNAPTKEMAIELRQQRDRLAEALKEALLIIPDKTWVEDRLTFRKWERLIAAVEGGSND